MATTILEVADVKHLGVDFNLVGPDQLHEIGIKLTDKVGRILVYTKASSIIVADRPVFALIGWVTTSESGNQRRWDGIAPKSFAANDFGWIVTVGEVLADVGTGLVINEFVHSITNASSQLAETVAVDEGGATVHTAGFHAVRATLVSTVVSNKATVRVY